MTQPNNVLNTQKRYDSLIEETAKEYSDHNYIDECVEIPAFKACAIQMAQWKDEQLESKLMQIIILAQQGYTCGATDEMILKQCKEVIQENDKI